MRLSCVAVLAVALGLSGCGGESYGTAADSFFMPQIGDSYIALKGGNFFSHGAAAAVVIAPGIAVTNAHNSNIVNTSSVIGGPHDYDLLYFHTNKTATLPTAPPSDGEAVIAYGQDTSGNLRVSRGVISKFWPAAFGFACDAGPGFSGGPVVDAKTGMLVGITYGYFDQPGSSQRLMVAYNMAFVASEFAAVKAAPKPSPDRNNR